MKGAFQTVRDLGLEPTHSGKVRETFDLGDTLFIVTTDRLSAFDVVLPEGLTGKGRILNGLTTFWFRGLQRFFPTHFLGTSPDLLPAQFQPHAAALEGRWMRVRKAERLPVECVVRGYITGSGWSEYQKTQSICGIPLPAGLVEFDRFTEPLFTPTTKADEGHDLPMTPEETRATLGADVAREVEALSKAIYAKAAEYALRRGVIIADTKFEFGWIDGKLSLIDEALTPDSSRFWPRASLENRGPGWKAPEPWDKQYVRDYLKTLDWNREPPGPRLPAEVEEEALARYRQAVVAITEGRDEPDWEA